MLLRGPQLEKLLEDLTQMTLVGYVSGQVHIKVMNAHGVCLL